MALLGLSHQITNRKLKVNASIGSFFVFILFFVFQALILKEKPCFLPPKKQQCAVASTSM